MENKKLTLGSLFDGSGGFPLGGLLAGITPVWASEIEPFPIRVTTKRMPFMKHYGNVSEMDGGKVEPVDIITFGSPCQDMSVAGKRAGLDGSRSNLFYEAVRIIKEMRKATGGKYPKWACWENVPGAFSSSGGDDFRCVLESLCQIKDDTVSIPKPDKWASAGEIVGDGYSIAWRVLDAQYWGVPQRRKRIYLVADFNGGSAGKILFESEGLSGYSAEGFRSWQGAPGCPADSLGEAVSHVAVENHPADSRVKIEEGGVVQTLSSRMGTGGNNVPLVMKIRSGCEGGGKGPLIQTDKSATLSCNNDQTLFEPCSWDGGQISPTLTKQNAGGGQRMPDKDNFNCVLQPFGICSNDSNSMKSPNPHSGIYEADTSRTIDVKGGNPACNQGGIAIVESVPIEGNGTRPSHMGAGFSEDKVSYTLNSTEVHGVAYSMTTGSFPNVVKDKAPPVLARDYKDATVVTEPSYGIGRDAFNQGSNAQFRPAIEEELQPTIVAKGPGAVAHPYGFYPQMKAECVTLTEDKSVTLVNGTNPGYHNGVLETGYTVRRLVPTECARLQGFPDWWCSDLGTAHPTDEEVYFWYKVFKTYTDINGGKMKSDKQLRKWLTDPYSDSAEYKMWGNGVALPCVCFVLSGIVYYSQFEA